MKARIMTRRPTVVLSIIAAVSCTNIAYAAKLVDKAGDWSMFIHDAAQKKICFIASRPSSSTPKDAKRDQAFVLQ